MMVYGDLAGPSETVEHPTADLVRLKNDKIHATLNFSSSSACHLINFWKE